MTHELLVLSDALAAVERRLAPVAVRDDFDLPIAPLLVDNLPAPDIIEAFAALYLHAELDNAAIVLCVEEIQRARYQLTLSTEAAGALDRFAEIERRSPSREDRRRIFVRLFGMGASSTDEPGNHGFLSQLAAFAAAAVAGADEARAYGSATTMARERLRASLERLLASIAASAGGDLPGHARRLNALVGSALAVLADGHLQRLAGARSVSQLVRALLGPHAVDVSSASARGRAGRQLIQAAGALGPALRSGVPTVSMADPLALHAAQWLSSYGVGTRLPSERQS